MTYHDSGDPWSNGDPCHGIRDNYYGVSSWPDLEVDGVFLHLHPGVTTSMQNAFNSRIAVDSPVAINLMAINNGTSIQASAIVTSGDQAISGNYKIRFALISKLWTEYTTPSTGVSEFHNDVVSMAPNASGLDFSIDANSEETYVVDFPWPESLAGIEIEPENVHVVCFVQNDNSKEVLQAEQADLSSDYYFRLNAAEDRLLVNPGTEVSYDLGIVNMGLEDDTYDITVATDLPDGWSFSYTTPDGEQTGEASLSLASRASYTSTVTITSTEGSNGMSGYVDLTFTSQGLDELVITKRFFVMTAGQVLVVNADSEGRYGDYYSNALDAVDELIGSEPVSWSIWPYEAKTLNTDDLDELSVSVVIWYVGLSINFEDDHKADLVDFLNAGGNLWINGSYAPTALYGSNLIGMMGTTVQGINSTVFDVTGIEGDAIGDGVEFQISGGDGADNAGITRTLQLVGSEAAFRFGANQWAAVHNAGEGYRTLLFGFPFEAISSQESRNLVMERCVRYLLNLESGVTPDHGTEIPAEFNLSEAWPNPFNPSTSFSVTLPHAAELTVTVHNVMGQEVSRLVAGNTSAGVHRYQFDASHLASGVYFIRASIPGEQVSMKKVMLVR